VASNVRLAGRRFPRARPRCFEKCLILPHSFTGHVALRHGDKFIRSALKFAIGAPLCRFRLFLAARGPQGAQTSARRRTWRMSARMAWTPDLWTWVTPK